MLSHNHAHKYSDVSGRYAVHANLHLGVRGPAGSEYIVHDTEGEHKDVCFSTLAYVKCYVAYRLYHAQMAPWFHGRDVRELGIKLVKATEYNEVVSGG